MPFQLYCYFFFDRLIEKVLVKKKPEVIPTCITLWWVPANLTPSLTSSCYPVTSLRDTTVNATVVLTVVTIKTRRTGWWLKDRLKEKKILDSILIFPVYLFSFYNNLSRLVVFKLSN